MFATPFKVVTATLLYVAIFESSYDFVPVFHHLSNASRDSSSASSLGEALFCLRPLNSSEHDVERVTASGLWEPRTGLAVVSVQ